MKRFTETKKWEDPWFRKLSPSAKLLWQWLLDGCDNAGIIDPDMDLASFQIGYPMGIDTLSEIGDRIIKIRNGKLMISKFIEFQYGKLSHDCKAHRPIFQSLEKNDINANELHEKGVPKGMDTLKEKEEDKEKEKDLNSYSSEIIDLWNSLPNLGSVRSVTASRRKAIAARMKDSFFCENWQTAIRMIPESQFLTGINDRGWKADIDWFLRPDTVAKIIEGKYHNKKPAGGNHAGIQEDIQF